MFEKKEAFRKYEIAHIESARLMDVSPSLKSLIKYVDAIGCQLKLELKEDKADYALIADECGELNGANTERKAD